MSDGIVWSEDSEERIVEWVSRKERRSTNDVMPWRANKLMPFGKSILRWGLTAPVIGPLGPFELRIENKPDPDIAYNDPNGKFSGVFVPLIYVPDTWIPVLISPDLQVFPFDCWMLGFFGKVTGYNPNDNPPHWEFTIEGGICDGLKPTTGAPWPGRFVLLNNAEGYAVRVSQLVPNIAQGTIIAQGCDPKH